MHGNTSEGVELMTDKTKHSPIDRLCYHLGNIDKSIKDQTKVINHQNTLIGQLIGVQNKKYKAQGRNKRNRTGETT